MGVRELDLVTEYTGYMYDQVLGVYYAKARMYDAADRRFMAEDPVKDGDNWYAYCADNPVIYTDPWGLEWGYLRDFAKEVNRYLFMHVNDPTYDFSQSGKVKITVGSGYFYRSACFYFSGDVEFHNRNYTYTQKVAESVGGKLYLQRTDFLKALGIPYVQFEQEFTITQIGNSAKSIAFGAIVTLVTSTVNPVASFVIGALAGELFNLALYEPGKYKAVYIVAEVCHPDRIRTTYIDMMTMEVYRKGTDRNGREVWVVEKKASSLSLGENFQSLL